MSCDYFPSDPIPFSQLKSVPGLTLKHTDESKRRNAVILTDGTNYVWAFRAGDGSTQFTSFGLNDETHIIGALEQHFNTVIQDEHTTGRWRDEVEPVRRELYGGKLRGQ